MTIEKSVMDCLSPISGKICCRRRVGRARSLSLGFGEKIPHSIPGAIDAFYGEWEVGTFFSAWRIIQADTVLCGSADSVDSVAELDAKLQTIFLGAVLTIEELPNHDIRIKFADNLSVEVICTFSDDDEMFHVFGPNRLYVECRYPGKWTVGLADIPWRETESTKLD